MASLSDKLKQSSKQLVRGPGGSLAEETTEEVQSLAGKAGLQAPPLTPAGTAMIGGNPDQQKMAGTPAQKQAALDLSSQAPVGATLQDALRRRQTREQGTAGEEASIDKSENLKNLGHLGDRVNDFINAQRQKLQQQAGQGVEVRTNEAQVEAMAGNASATKDVLGRLRQDPNNMQLQLQLNQLLGRNINSVASPEEINSLYESAVDSIARGGAGNVDNDLKVSDLTNMQQFGYDLPTLSNLLGTPVEQLGQMSVGQLRDQVNQLQAEEFSKTQQLEQQATSGQLGAAERALAREGAREASRVGTRSSEADIQALEDQIANADQVAFGGKVYKVDELLQDDTISSIITEYMNSAPGSPLRAQLEKSEPELIQFIQKNQAVLQDAASHIASGTAQFQDIQKFNKQLVSNLPANLASIVAPEAGSLQAGRIDVSNKPMLQWAQQNPQAAQALQGIADDDARALAGLSLDELNALQIGQAGGKWDQYLQDKKAIQDLKQRASQTNDPDEIMKMVFGGNYTGNYQQLAHEYRNQRLAKQLGLPTKFDEQWAELDPNQDGFIEGPGFYRDLALRKAEQSYTLKDALAGKRADVPTPGQPLMRAPEDVSGNWSEDQRKVWDALSGPARDGRVDEEELYRSNLTVDDLLNRVDNRSPVLNNTREFAGAFARKAQDEILGKHKLDTIADVVAAQNELYSLRDKLGSKLQNTGNANLAIAAFKDITTSLSDKIEQMKEEQKRKTEEELKKMPKTVPWRPR